MKISIERAIEILDLNAFPKYTEVEEKEACRMGMEALKRQRWIPVGERLPEEKQRVLFWNPSNEAIYVGFYSYTGKRGTVWFRTGKTDYASKYWMSLPEPPEEGGNGNAAD